MLEAIRKRSASVLVKILFGLLILSFAAWGVGDMIRGGLSGPNTVATVGNVDIAPNQLSVEVQRETERLRQILGNTLDSDQIRAFGLPYQALNRIVDRTLYDLGAHGLGITVSDDRVRTLIQAAPSFKAEDGRFDRLRFEQVLRTNGMNEAFFVNLMRGDETRRQYLRPIAVGARVPGVLADTLYRFHNERRVAETLTVADSTITDIPDPSEDALAAFHQEHADLFTAPEYRTLTAVVLRAADLAKEIAIPDSELQQAYDNRAESFHRPERRTLLQIRADSEEQAKRIHERLANGEDFAAVALDAAGMDENAIKMGTATRDQLLPEIAAAVFDLANGSHSVPVKSPLGWHVFKVAGIERARQKTFDEARDELKRELAAERALEVLSDMGNKLEDLLGGGATLDEAGKTLDLPVIHIEAVDADGKGPDGNVVETLPAGHDFLATAFTTEPGLPSMLTELGPDGYFVVRVDRVTPPALDPLDTVRERVVAAWRDDQRAAAAEKRATAIEERVKGGETMLQVAESLGMTVGRTAPFTRQPRGTADLPEATVQALFDSELGAVITGRSPIGHVVARLAEIVPADPAGDGGGLEGLRRQIAQGVQGDLYFQLSAALRKEFPVHVNSRVIDQMFTR